MCHQTDPYKIMSSCGPVRVFVPHVKINVSSDLSRQNNNFIWSRQSVCPKYKYQWVIRRIPTKSWYDVVPSECLSQIEKSMCHWTTPNEIMSSRDPVFSYVLPEVQTAWKSHAKLPVVDSHGPGSVTPRWFEIGHMCC